MTLGKKYNQMPITTLTQDDFKPNPHFKSKVLAQDVSNDH